MHLPYYLHINIQPSLADSRLTSLYPRTWPWCWVVDWSSKKCCLVVLRMLLGPCTLDTPVSGITSSYKHQVWYDMIWYDMTWYDMIWYDMIWNDVISFDMMIWYGTVWCDVIWYNVIRCEMTWYDMIWYDMMAWYGLIWHIVTDVLFPHI